MDSRPRFRIFVSSPSDLGPEREVCNRVIRRLGDEWASKATVEPLLWEQEPMRMDSSFQDQIPLPSEAEMVVTMIWTRLGKRLHARFKEAEDQEAPTGTLFELRNALKGREASPVKMPDVLVYRKTAQPVLPPITEREKFKQAVEAYEEVDAFFSSKYFQDAQGNFLGAYHTFVETPEFEQKLGEHLRRLLLHRLGDPVAQAPAARPVARWEGGSPYRGLEFFDFEHSGIFFGRTSAVSKFRERLTEQAEKGTAFVLLMGQSGSGKSSLVRAGLLPAITPPGVIAGVGLWRRAVLRPADASGLLVDHLATVLETGDAATGVGLPELAKTPGELAKKLRQSPVAAAGFLARALQEIASGQAAATLREWNNKRASLTADGNWAAAGELERLIEQCSPPQARLLLFVDQLEEIFTAPGITQADREAFINHLAALAESGQVWVVASMRSDFTPRSEELPELVRLKDGDRTIHLLPPQAGEIAAMIRGPAEAAGLTFEKLPESDERLDARVLAEAVQGSLPLPLLEFMLDELYQRREEGTGRLTFKAYDELGGIGGALNRRADEVYRELSKAVPGFAAAFSTVLGQLVGLQPGSEPASRVLPAGRFAEGTPEAQIVQRLIAARLLVADETTVRVAHERLLQWPRVEAWIRDNRAFLLARERVRIAAKRWHEEQKTEDLLLPAGLALGEAEKAVQEKPGEFEAGEIEFVEASSARVQKLAEEKAAREKAELERERRASRRILMSVSIGGLLAAAFGVGAFLQYRQAQAERTIAEEKSVLAEKRGVAAESSAAIANEERDAGDSLAGELLGNLRGKVPPAVYADSKGLVFNKIDSVQPDPAAPNAAQAQAHALDTKGLIEQKEGELESALKFYQQALTLRESAVQREKTSANQHDLVLSYDNLGDVHAALAQVPDAKVAAEQAEALKYYQKSFEMTQELVKTEPANGNWQNDLAASYAKVGGLYFDQNDFGKAAAQYKEGLALAEKLVARDSTLPKWQALRAFFTGNLGRTALRTGNYDTARAKLTEAQTTLSALVAQKKLTAEQAGWLSDFEADIASLPPK